MQKQTPRMTDRELDEAWRTLTECYYPSAEHTLAERIDRVCRITGRLLAEVRERRRAEVAEATGHARDRIPRLSSSLEAALLDE